MQQTNSLSPAEQAMAQRRPPPAQAVVEAARGYVARAEAGEVIERRALEWAQFILRTNAHE